MSLKTIFLSRLLGLYLLICALALVVRKQAILTTLTDLLSDPVATLFVGVFTLLAGLTMVLLHNIWTGGPVPIVVTLIGWTALLKALLLLFLPLPMQARFFLQGLHYAQHFYLYMIVCFALGAFLAYHGFRARPA